MEWASLFSVYRLGQAAVPEPSVRSEFQRDGDRIMFSAAFRRLQDKTQVFPLAQNDYVRTRLTHSLEVSCVGRSLGASVGRSLLQRYPDLAGKIEGQDVGDIVAAACLAHDIGNPPFGHFGEQAMRDYFLIGEGQEIAAHLPEKARADLLNIEGNAQGFRVLNRLESADIQGGLRLTATTLASASKYPCLAGSKFYKKNGCYLSDWQDFKVFFERQGIDLLDEESFKRHPLSFLMESADDICYLIVDIEDAYQVGEVSYDVARALLGELADDLVDQKRFSLMRSASDRLAYLRAKAIGRLVQETVEVFWQNESALLMGERYKALLEDISSYQKLKKIREFAVKSIYQARPVVEVQIAGYRILSGLLEVFCRACFHRWQGKLLPYDAMVLALIPKRYQKGTFDDLYEAILMVCDYITGMTDSYAVSLYKKLTGISLPVA